MSNTPNDDDLTACYREANGEMHGKAQPLTTQRIFRAMRAAIIKWGTPQPVAREPLPPASPCAMTESEYRLFKLGWLEAEAAHGITQKGGSDAE